MLLFKMANTITHNVPCLFFPNTSGMNTACFLVLFHVSHLVIETQFYFMRIDKLHSVSKHLSIQFVHTAAVMLLNGAERA